jgi:phage shock protein E
MSQEKLILMIAGALIIYFLMSRFAGVSSSKQVAEKLTAGARVIDVRSPAEFSAGHYKGSLNIPVEVIGTKATVLGEKNKPIIVYCASGARSATAAKILRTQGFTDVLNAGSIHRLPR